MCPFPSIFTGDFKEHTADLKKIAKELEKPYNVIIADTNYGISNGQSKSVAQQRAFQFDSLLDRWKIKEFKAVISIAEDYNGGVDTLLVFFLSDKQFGDAAVALAEHKWLFKHITWVKATGKPNMGKRWGHDAEYMWFCWKADSTSGESERFVVETPEDAELYNTTFLKRPLSRKEMFQYKGDVLNLFQKPTAIFDRIYKWCQSDDILALDVTCGSGTALVSVVAYYKFSDT